MRAARSALVAIAVLACSKPRSEASEPSVDAAPKQESAGKVTYPQLEVAEPHEKVPVVPMPGMPSTYPRTPASRGPVPQGDAPWDEDAVTNALSSVPYKDCGTGGPGKIVVTFAPTGSVRRATIAAGEYGEATRACVEKRFRAAKLPAFAGDDVNISWSINL